MAYFPVNYLEDFFSYLKKNSDRYEVLTFADLDWAGDTNYKMGYPEELRNWRDSLRTFRDPSKAYIFLQHDVDDDSTRTMNLLRMEESYGIRSNVMIFTKRIHRQKFIREGLVEYTPYLDCNDYCYLKALEKKGFVIGYHCNTFERSLFDREKADRLFVEDIRELREHFDLRFFSPHGGPRGPDGRSNTCLEIPKELRNGLFWVANKYSFRLDGQYSDGGISGGRRKADQFDVKKFVSRMKPGNRYRVLVHPQYYDEKFKMNQKLDSEWYRNLMKSYSDPAGSSSYWSDLRLPKANIFDSVLRRTSVEYVLKDFLFHLRKLHESR